jgi:hypothetical protein
MPSTYGCDRASSGCGAVEVDAEKRGIIGAGSGFSVMDCLPIKLPLTSPPSLSLKPHVLTTAEFGHLEFLTSSSLHTGGFSGSDA